MTLSRGLALGLVAAVAALVFTMVNLASAGTVNAQTPPATVYGKGQTSGARIEAFIGGRSCGSTTVNAAGEWSIPIPTTAACAPTAGAAISFTINGNPATATPAAVWQGGGLPPDVANGYALQAGGPAATATATAAPPKTGGAGMLQSGQNAWVVLGIALIALGAVAGTRVAAGRAR
jgi:hypothetical protein